MVPVVLIAAALLAPPAGPPDRGPGELVVWLEPGYSLMAEPGPERYGIQRLEPMARLSARRPDLLPPGRPVRVILEPGRDEEETARLLDREPGVVWCEPHWIYRLCGRPDDPRLEEQWHLRNTGQEGGVPGIDLGAFPAWERTLGDPAQVVAVVDTGIQPDHPDLIHRHWVNPGEIPENELDDDGNGYVDDWIGWDFVGMSRIPRDDYGHGTHVAGIIAAEGQNDLGGSGVAPGVRIMTVRVGSLYGIHALDAALGLVYAADNGATILNCSWGGYIRSSLVETAIRYSQDRGCLVVAAAGNDGTRLPHYPAALPGVLAVGALDRSGRRARFDEPASSNLGTWVDLAAPGRSILSTFIGGTYAAWSGTSMAAPGVSGVAALVISDQPDLRGESLGRRVIGTAVELLQEPREERGLLGAGRAQADRALWLPGSFRLHLLGMQLRDPQGNRDGRADPGELIRLSLRCRNLWLPAGELRLQLGTDHPDLTILTDQVDWGFLGTDEELDHGEEPFLLQVDPGMEPGETVELILEARDLGTGRIQRLLLTLPITPPAPLQGGWPITVPDSVVASPLLVDLDMDGCLEVLLADGDGVLHALGADGQPRPGWPVELGQPVISTAAAGDLLGSGEIAVVVGDTGGGLHALDRTGRPLPGWPVVGGGHGAPASVLVVDLDRDGPAEVVDATWDGVVRIWSGEGRLRASWPLAVPVGMNSSPAGADLDLDGHPELAIATKAGEIHLLRPDGTSEMGWPTHGNGPFLSAPALVDPEGDGLPGLLCADLEGFLHYWSPEGIPHGGWPIRLGEGAQASPAVADLDGDGIQEVAAASLDGGVYLLDPAGRPLPGWPIWLEDRLVASPVMGDLDGDGRGEVALGAGEWLYAWDRDGSSLPGWPILVGGRIIGGPALGDLDGDGDLELVVASENRSVLTVDTPGRALPNRQEWRQYQADSGRTGGLLLEGTPRILCAGSLAGANRSILMAWVTEPMEPPPVVTAWLGGTELGRLEPWDSGVQGLLLPGRLPSEQSVRLTIRQGMTPGPSWPAAPLAGTAPAAAPMATDPCGAGGPRIWAGGYGLSGGGSWGGTLVLRAWAEDGTARVELWWEGRSTGLELRDDGASADGAAGDGWYGLALSVPPDSIPADPVHLQLRARDTLGRLGSPWPYPGCPWTME